MIICDSRCSDVRSPRAALEDGGEPGNGKPEDGNQELDQSRLL
jgi:hypothetical protein